MCTAQFSPLSESSTNRPAKAQGITHPPLVRKESMLSFPVLLQRFQHLLFGDSLLSIVYFQNTFSNGKSWSFVGESWVLETINVYCSQVWGITWVMKLRNTVLHQKMERIIHLIFQSDPFSSGSQVSGTKIVVPNEISRAFQNLHTPYAEQSVSVLNGKQLCPLVCFVPLFCPLSEERCIIQCFSLCEFSWGHSCFCCQLLFWIQTTILKLHIASLIEPKPF